MGGTLLIKAGDEIVKDWVIGEKDDAAKRQVKVIKTWIYGWMRRGVLFQEEYEM